MPLKWNDSNDPIVRTTHPAPSGSSGLIQSNPRAVSVAAGAGQAAALVPPERQVDERRTPGAVHVGLTVARPLPTSRIG